MDNGGPQPTGADAGIFGNDTDEDAAPAAGETPDELDELVRDGAAYARNGPSERRKSSASPGPFKIVGDKLVQEVSGEGDGAGQPALGIALGQAERKARAAARQQAPATGTEPADEQDDAPLLLL